MVEETLSKSKLINYFLYREDEINDIILLRSTIIGEMWIGKTTFAYRIAEIIQEFYGSENVNILLSDYFKDLIYGLNDKLVQVLILDDPLTYHAFSGNTKERLEMVAKLARIRHEWADREGVRRGIIILLTLTQYYFLLDPFFRNAPLIFFKSILNDYNERKFIEKILGKQKARELAKLTASIYFGKKQSNKSWVLAKPIGMRPRWIQYQLPKLRINPKRKREKETILDTIDNKILRLRLQNKSLREIAREVDISHEAVRKRLKKLQKIGITIK